MGKLVSVITVTYNNAKSLPVIAGKLLSQDYENIQYIIIDGGSTDGTVEIIKELSLSFGKRMKWISEPDSGIYNAINKGLRLADGDIIGLMFDEFTTDHVISQIVSVIEKENADAAHGDINYIRNGKVVRKWRMGIGTLNRGWMPGHQTLYITKEVMEQYGFYKEDYKIAADYEYIIRILKEGRVKLAYIPDVLVNMYYGEDSASTGGFSNYVRSFMEGRRALRENHMPHPTLTSLIRLVRVLVQFI